MTECELLQRYEAGERDFRYAKLRYADLRGARLTDANLTDANLRGAKLQGANLRCISLCGAIIDGAILYLDDIGGPGHILCALTDTEWAWVEQQREEEDDE